MCVRRNLVVLVGGWKPSYTIEKPEDVKYDTALVAAMFHFPLWLLEQWLEDSDFKAKLETPSPFSVQECSTSSLTRLQNSREANNWDFWEGEEEEKGEKFWKTEYSSSKWISQSQPPTQTFQWWLMYQSALIQKHHQDISDVTEAFSFKIQ